MAPQPKIPKRIFRSISFRFPGFYCRYLNRWSTKRPGADGSHRRKAGFSFLVFFQNKSSARPHCTKGAFRENLGNLTKCQLSLQTWRKLCRHASRRKSIEVVQGLTNGFLIGGCRLGEIDLQQQQHLPNPVYNKEKWDQPIVHAQLRGIAP